MAAGAQRGVHRREVHAVGGAVHDQPRSRERASEGGGGGRVRLPHRAGGAAVAAGHAPGGGAVAVQDAHGLAGTGEVVNDRAAHCARPAEDGHQG